MAILLYVAMGGESQNVKNTFLASKVKLECYPQQKDWLYLWKKTSSLS